MLSDFSLTRFTTTAAPGAITPPELWFAFRFFFDKIYNNKRFICWHMRIVVICFQIFLWQDLQQHLFSRARSTIVVICFQIFLWQDLQQRRHKWQISRCCCDLLSDFSLTRFTTTLFHSWQRTLLLWFAFIFFFDKIYNNQIFCIPGIFIVVICFQIFLWQNLQQLAVTGVTLDARCDLLSNFSLTRFRTTYPRSCHC